MTVSGSRGSPVSYRRRWWASSRVPGRPEGPGRFTHDGSLGAFPRVKTFSEAVGDFSLVTSQLFVSQLPKRVNRFAVHIQLE